WMPDGSRWSFRGSRENDHRIHARSLIASRRDARSLDIFPSSPVLRFGLFVGNFVGNFVEFELSLSLRIGLTLQRSCSKALVPELFPRGRAVPSAGKDPNKLPPLPMMRRRSQGSAD